MKSSSKKKNLIIIGGAEDKKGEKIILNFVADKFKESEGIMLIATIATESPNIVIEQYKKYIFKYGDKRNQRASCHRKRRSF